MWKAVVGVALAGLVTSLGLLVWPTSVTERRAVTRTPRFEDVQPGSPAEQVGLLRGDIVLAVDDVDVPMTEVEQRISCGCAALETRRLTYERDGERFVVLIRAQHRRIGIHFGPATRYEPSAFRAAWTAYRAWQRQAFAPAQFAAALAAPCPFGERHLISIHSAPHRRAAIASVVLFWGSLLSLFGAFAFALRRRKPATI